MIRILLVVLLALSLVPAGPAHVLEAPGALDLGAPRLNKSNGHTALGIRTILGAVLDIQLIEHILRPLVLLEYVLHVLIVEYALHEIDAVDEASLHGMVALLAGEAEDELAEGAPAVVEFFFNGGKLPAAFDGTPAHVVHVGNGIV